MPDKLYKILGVKPDASEKEIRQAYRNLAKKHHPDLNPGDKASEDKFREVQAAHDILSDATKRRQYDAGEIDSEGKETPRSFYREYAAGGDGHAYRSTAGFDDLGDIFSELFRRGHGHAGHAGPGGGETHIRMQGGDLRYQMQVPFLDAVLGATTRLTLPGGQTLDVTIPPGHRDGQVLRLKGEGMPGIGGGHAGDAYIEVQVTPHATFRRDGDDIVVDLPISIDEAVLGASLRVPTVHGPVTMKVPKGANTGDVLRLKGKGVPARGKRPASDQKVVLSVKLPKTIDADLSAAIGEWAKTHHYDPRSGMEKGG